MKDSLGFYIKIAPSAVVYNLNISCFQGKIVKKKVSAFIAKSIFRELAVSRTDTLEENCNIHDRILQRTLGVSSIHSTVEGTMYSDSRVYLLLFTKIAHQPL